MMDRLNMLKQYMDFYKQSGAGAVPTGYSNYGGSPSPVKTYGVNPDRNALLWAQGQIGQEAPQRPDAPNFFGGGQPYQSAEYVQPQAPQRQDGITNYLRQFMERQRQPNNSGMTLGVRG